MPRVVVILDTCSLRTNFLHDRRRNRRLRRRCRLVTTPEVERECRRQRVPLHFVRVEPAPPSRAARARGERGLSRADASLLELQEAFRKTGCLTVLVTEDDALRRSTSSGWTLDEFLRRAGVAPDPASPAAGARRAARDQPGTPGSS